MTYVIESFEHAGLKVEVGQEEDASFADPRDMDNLGTMVCWHPDYILGDYQFTSPEGRGAIGDRLAHGSGKGSGHDTRFHRDDFSSMEVLERYLRLAEKAVVVLPLYLLDHSGISMTAGSNTVGRGDTASGGSDSWGNPCGWDTTMVGFIYTTAERIVELCGEPQLATDAFYCPRKWPEGTPAGQMNWPAERSAEAWIAKQLAVEVDLYDQWLTGQVYYYTVEDADGDMLDSCGGYLGGGLDAAGKELDGFDFTVQEAREAAESCAASLAEKDAARRSGWALARVAMPV